MRVGRISAGGFMYAKQLRTFATATSRQHHYAVYFNPLALELGIYNLAHHLCKM